MESFKISEQHGATYSNTEIGGEARGHLGNNFANTIVNNYGGTRSTLFPYPEKILTVSLP